MSELLGLLTATAAISRRNAGSWSSAGWFMPSADEAKNVNRSRYSVPSLASTSVEPCERSQVEDELEAVGEHVRGHPLADGARVEGPRGR